MIRGRRWKTSGWIGRITSTNIFINHLSFDNGMGFATNGGHPDEKKNIWMEEAHPNGFQEKMQTI